ncbi:MAG: single-stranded DNA-binding protein [Patescibacteria group bacterium]|nr:single-stranded DNA-binding protein [Patescibacteria group bacterium]
MSSRSLNKVILIGNLTRDPELRYTPAGTAVCTFGLATNRSWTTQSGETKEETEFHRIVAWNKLGELCSQLLAKGRKVYVEGRLATHSWAGQDGVQHTSTEIVIEDMIILDSKKVVKEEDEMGGGRNEAVEAGPADSPSGVAVPTGSKPGSDIKSTQSDTAGTGGKGKKGVKPAEKKDEAKSEETESPVSEDITPDDIPF